MLEQLNARIRRLRAVDSGSSLVPVIVTIVIISALGLTFLVLISNSVSTTSATRASVQSSSAADAGVETATSHVDQGCTSTTLTNDDPQFTAEIRFSAAEDPQDVDWDSTPLSCPDDVDGWVHLRATGEAAAEGMRDASGDEQTAEAVYEWIAPETPEERLGNVAMYAVRAAGFNINMQPHSSSKGDLIIRERSITRPVQCNGATIPGSLIVESNQSVALRDGCRVNGDVETGGNLVIERNGSRATSVGGDVLVTGRLSFTAGVVEGNVRVHDQTIRPPKDRSRTPTPSDRMPASRAGSPFPRTPLSTAGGCTTGTGWRAREDTSLTGQLCGLQRRGQVGSTRELDPRSSVDVTLPASWNGTPSTPASPTSKASDTNLSCSAAASAATPEMPSKTPSAPTAAWSSTPAAAPTASSWQAPRAGSHPAPTTSSSATTSSSSPTSWT
ncbi:polymer-forming cytoskeletal protein [Nesterenkonia sp. NBAIMH1]|uniref:polymer-forming cytoskeletal protein n=1 Tax=Nesterenkonia sp. NBAIMH1 TaxID=2600320 RepID=UPI0011B84470|nr:polymer-forming cytoskeletal protein [Nesterenkonia sp. NBAIMH1]